LDTALLTSFLIALLAIANPLGKIPVWVQACGSNPPAVRRRLAVLVTGTAFAILCGALLLGREVLEVFSLDLVAFRIGGGIVILLIGIGMLRGEAIAVDTGGESEGGDAFERAKARFRDILVPMAIPILAGPGTITTCIVYGWRAGNWLDRAALGGVLLAVMLVVFLALLAAHRIQALVGDMALEVQTRLFGLILVAIAAQLIVEGLGEAFPSWLTPGSPIADDVAESAAAQSGGGSGSP